MCRTHDDDNGYLDITTTADCIRIDIIIMVAENNHNNITRNLIFIMKKTTIAIIITEQSLVLRSNLPKNNFVDWIVFQPLRRWRG